MRAVDTAFLIGLCTRCGKQQHLRRLDILPRVILCFDCWVEVKRHIETTCLKYAADMKGDVTPP